MSSLTNSKCDYVCQWMDGKFQSREVIQGIPQHPENPSRLLCIWRRFLESGIAERCVLVARRAALEEIQCCHTETHALVYGTDMVNRCTLTGSQELNRDNRSVEIKWNNEDFPIKSKI